MNNEARAKRPVFEKPCSARGGKAGSLRRKVRGPSVSPDLTRARDVGLRKTDQGWKEAQVHVWNVAKTNQLGDG